MGRRRESNCGEKYRARDRRDGKWFFIDNAFLRDGWGAEVGSYGIAVYVALALHAGYNSQTCWPSYRTLARLTGISRYQAMRAVKRLERHNLIRVVRRARNQTNLYVLLHPDQWRCDQSASEGADVVNQVDSLGGESQSERPPGVSEVDRLGPGSHNGRPVGVATSDSNKTHEQHSGEEQDVWDIDDSLSSMWQTALSDLRLRMTRATFETWLSRSRAIGLKNGVLTVAVPSQYARDWCTTRLLPTIQRSLHHVTGEDLEIKFRVAAALAELDD